MPSYRRRTGYTQAIVTLTDSLSKKRRDYWLGDYGTAESRERYHRVIAAWEANQRRFPPMEGEAPSNSAHANTIVEVIREYWRWAKGYYRPKHAQAINGALILLRQFFGRTPAVECSVRRNSDCFGRR
ncbi:MAG: hypothetical protein J5J06_06850 [Phycisphaerae bacterium]|nr:hypothetical protein [Phycisphaerae bacterium]